MKKRIGICSCSILLAFPWNVLAEQQATTPGMLEEVVITATRTAETVDETLAPVTVITRRDIEKNQFQSVTDALSRVPGVQFSRSGGPGQLADIYLRGTDSNHTLVLVDGIRIGSATNSRASLQNIPISQIERIEIVRGPRSTLYGSDAIGGVIHIFTRKAGDQFQGQVSAGGGSHGSYHGQASVSGPLGNSYYSVGLAHAGTNGFDVMENGVADSWGWPTAIEPDDDGYRETSGSIRLGHRFSEGNDIDFHAIRVFGTTEFDGDYQNETDFIQQVIGVTAHLRPLDFWDVTLLAGVSRDDADNFKDDVSASFFDTTRTQFNFQNDFIIGDYQILSAGIDYYNDEISSNTAYAIDSRDTTGMYLQYQLDYERHSVQAGVRYEDNEQFGDSTTYNLAYGIRLPYDFRITLNYGTAFRAPTFNELYWPDSGNQDLQPEESTTYEAAVLQEFSWGYWRLGIFRTDIDDLISGWPAENVDRARIDGLEAEADIRFNETWRLNLNLSLIDPRDRDSDLLLPRRAEETLTVDLDGNFGAWGIGATVLAAGSRYDDTANTVELSGYATLSLRADYRFDEHWQIQGKIDNLFDEDYTEVATYNTEGRVAYATVTYSF